MELQLPILPNSHHFAKTEGPHGLFLEAICLYVATGFFMDDDTFWRDHVCLLPGHHHVLDSTGRLVSSTPRFHWYYEPKDRSFDDALEEYSSLLTGIMREGLEGQKVILPLSGGLDSRSLAMVLKGHSNSVNAFSYEFTNGYAETTIARKIAQVCGFDFEAFRIPRGYLWSSIEHLAEITGCYSEFTHPRQMAVLPQMQAMQGVFALGHWGDVLFDRGAPKPTKEGELPSLLLKKMVKPGGMALAESLWKVWGLEGCFKEYLFGRVETALARIKIDNVSAKARAFKTQQWAHRWTTTNLAVFKEAHPICLPYYDHRLLEFICRVPEGYLADRRLQIAHIKQDAALSRIPWQAQRPFHLNNYHYNRVPFNLPYRGYHKLKRSFLGMVGTPYVQRNYELQFVGESNEQHLKGFLDAAAFQRLIPKSVVDTQLEGFYQKDSREYSHPVSMLLTLSLFCRKYQSTL